MKKKLLLALLILAPLHANAGLINTSAGYFNVTTVLTDYNSSTSLLSSQVWFGSSSLAAEFAALVGATLGYPHTCSGGPTCGPVFAYNNDVDMKSYASSGGVLTFTNVSRNLELYYAVATRATAVAEPGTLALLGAGLLALGLMRRRAAV